LTLVATLDATARRTSALPLVLLVPLLAALVLIARAAGLGDVEVAETFVLIFTSIVIEALPFILPGAALGGMAFPVCECGSVPVARRLIARGMHPAAGIAFMLAAPIVNPVVLFSTWVAYAGRGLGAEMVMGRAVLGVVLAIAAGWALGGERGDEMLRERDEPVHRTGSKPRAFADHLAGDFFFMGRFVVLGGALAALLQTALPQSLVTGVATTPVVGALALMGVAFVLSLCSEADAFVAVSFTPFPIGAQMAFLVFGPVVDAKLALLYGATFRRRFVLRLVTVAVPVTLAGSLWFEALVLR
jgi:uncharacterized protein